MSKVFGEITLKYWVDPEVLGETEAQALAMTREAIPEIITSDFYDDDEEWRGVEVVPATRGLVMTEAQRVTCRRVYNDWRAEGSVLAHRENSYGGDEPSSGDWHMHGETAKDLYGDLATFLFDIEDCGHQEVAVSRSPEEGSGVYTVACENCPETWTVRDGQVPHVRTFANGHGEWRAVVTQYGVGDAQEAMTDAFAAIRRELVDRGTDPEAIKARMTVERVGRVSRDGSLETEFKEVWADEN